MPKVPVPQIQKTIFQVRYKPVLKFYDLLYSVAGKLTEYPHWETDRLSVVLRDYDKRCSLNIAHNNFAYAQDSNDTENELGLVKNAISILIEGLEIEKCVRLGFRRIYLIPITFSFNSLVSVIYAKLFSQEERLRNLLPDKIEDLMYRVDLREDNNRFHLILGPVQRKQIPLLIEVKRHLDPETAESDYRKIIQKYPDVAIFLDIDLYQEGEEISVHDVTPFYLHARERVHRLAEEMAHYILSVELED